jgi:hypothetical protein
MLRAKDTEEEDDEDEDDVEDVLLFGDKGGVSVGSLIVVVGFFLKMEIGRATFLRHGAFGAALPAPLWSTMPSRCRYRLRILFSDSDASSSTLFWSCEFLLLIIMTTPTSEEEESDKVLVLSCATMASLRRRVWDDERWMSPIVSWH